MPVKINGLPAHVLLVHAVVVLVPLAALALVLHVAWPAARRRLGIVTPLLAFVSLVLVPVTTHAGEWLESRLPSSPAIRHHVELGHGLLPWVAGLFVLSVLAWVLGRRYDLAWSGATTARTADPPAPAAAGAGGGVTTLSRPAAAPARARLPVWATAVLTVVSVAVAVVSVVVLYRIGDSGAHAVWGPIANLPAR